MTSPPLVYVFMPLGGQDRWSVERFVRKVDALNESEFSRSTSAVRGTLIPGETFLGGPAWQIGVDGPGEAAVKAVIGDFRQLYGDHNRASAAKVLKILQRSAHARGTDAGRDMIAKLKGLRNALRDRRERDPRGKLLEETRSGAMVERPPRDIIDTWFNGEYFHDEPELAAQLGPDGHAAAEMMRLSLHTAIRDHLAYWNALREVAVAVLQDPALDG